MDPDIEELIEQMTLVRPEVLKPEALKLFKTIMAVLDERDKLKRQIEIKDEYLSLIYGYGFDYDGYEDSESLMLLIDSLVDYAKRAIKNDDKYAMYEGCGTNNSTKYYNILHEEVPKLEEEEEDE